MKKNLSIVVCAFAVLGASTGLSQTIFLGGDVSNAVNWDNGLPTSGGNPGTVAVDGTVPEAGSPITNYVVTQTAGAISNASFTGNAQSGGEWNLNGGSYTTRALNLSNAAAYNVGGGFADLGNNNRDVVVVSASSFNVTSGNVNLGRHLLLNQSSFTISGGTLTGDTDTDLGTRAFNNTGTMNFNGGTVSVFRLDFSGSGTTASFGGTSAGSVTANSFLGANVSLNFLTGTLMDLSFTDVADWAETQWDADSLLYNGQDSSSLGLSWNDVTTVGFGDGSFFEYDDGTNTLSLAVIPEPAPVTLFLLAGLAGLFLYRLRR